jgi:hypothetical protein
MLDCPVSWLSEFATEDVVVAKRGEVVDQGTYSRWSDVCCDHHALSHDVAFVVCWNRDGTRLVLVRS